MELRCAASKLLLGFALTLLVSQNVLANNESNPFVFRFSGGNPAPSFLGAGLGYRFQEMFELNAQTGMGWFDEINIQTFTAGSRFYILPYTFSPFLGGGLSVLKVTGSGSIQGLDESTVLAFLSGGLNIDFNPIQISLGLFFHFPVRLIFPFVDCGFTF